MIILWQKHTRWEIWRKNVARPFLSLAHNKKELEPLRVPGLPLLQPTDVQLQADLQAAIFLSETGLTLEEATGQVEAEIPVAPVLTPFQHGKPFVTEEEEKSLGTQMFNLHRWYLRMSNDEGKMFGVKYHAWPWFLPRGGQLLGVLRKFISHLPWTSPRRLYHHHLGFVSITYLYIYTFC